MKLFVVLAVLATCVLAEEEIYVKHPEAPTYPYPYSTYPYYNYVALAPPAYDSRLTHSYVALSPPAPSVTAYYVASPYSTVPHAAPAPPVGASVYYGAWQ